MEPLEIKRSVQLDSFNVNISTTAKIFIEIVPEKYQSYIKRKRNLRAKRLKQKAFHQVTPKLKSEKVTPKNISKITPENIITVYASKHFIQNGTIANQKSVQLDSFNANIDITTKTFCEIVPERYQFLTLKGRIA